MLNTGRAAKPCSFSPVDKTRQPLVYFTSCSLKTSTGIRELKLQTRG